MPIPEAVRGTGDFRKNPNNINRKGRPISIKNQLKQLLAKNGELAIPAENFKRKVTKEGKEFYIFKIPTQEALAAKLITMAMSKNSNGFHALKLLLETFDGKAKQEIEQKEEIIVEYKNVSKQFANE
jgi:hypothetical protein